MERMRDLLRQGLRQSLGALPELDRLEAAWPVVCGRALAGRGRVVGLVQGEVRVEAESELWMQQMISMRSTLTAELARASGVPLTGIHFTRRLR